MYRKMGIVIFILLQEEYLIFVLNFVDINNQKIMIKNENMA